MAILIRCKKCKTEMKLSSQKCKNCHTNIPTRGKSYKVIVRYLGKKTTKIVPTLALAREIETKLKNDITKGQFDIKKNKPIITLHEFWEKQYFPWIQENKKSWYIDNYNYNKNLKDKFGNKTFDSISPFDIEKLVLSLKKRKNKQGKPLAPATIKHQLVLLNRIFNIAEQWGVYSGQNPCKKVKKPKLNNQVTEYLNSDELSRLLEVLKTWENKIQASIVLFSLYTGIRPKELFKLEWRDIDYEKRTFTLRDPKGVLDQVLPLSPKALNVLNNVPREYETPFIFYSVNGKQRKTIRHGWKQIKKLAGIHQSFRYYDLRHNFASYLVSSGESLYTVQKLLCHKDSKTTQRYAHLADEALRDAVNLSDKLLEPKTKSKVINLKDHTNEK